MAGNDVWVLGGFQTDFAHNWTKAGMDVSDLFAEVVGGSLESAAIGADVVEVIHVGNAFAQLFTGQGQLGGLPATVEPALWGVPASNHEAACASGSVAILAAMADLQSERYDCALLLGAELEKSVPSDVAPKHLGAAAWIGHEGDDARYMWPHMFSALADEYDRRYGIDDEHLHAIAELNLRNARANPLAQTRTWEFGPSSFTDNDEHNPVVEGRMRRTDCSQLTDGAAGAVLVSERLLRRRPELGRGRPLARIAGWGHTTVGLSLKQKLAQSHDSEYILPHVRRAAQDALARAGLQSVDDLDGIETHDCFTPSEYMAIDHLGITAPGESWKAIENGDLEIGGRMPVNPSGGLIGGGHPVGATGVRMLVDACRQVSGTAGAYQVQGARRFGTLNIGGSTTTTVSLVLAGAE